MSALVALMIAAGAVALFLAIAATPPAAGLGAAVEAELAATGVANPVTAVLLDFRSWDTLLELVVVLLAALAAGALAPPAPRLRRLDGPVASAAADLLAPAIVVTAGYLLWIGAKAPGGAFQAAATLAGGLILLEVVGRPVRPRSPLWTGRAAASGAALFLAAGAAAAVVEGAFLDWPDAYAGWIILAVEAAATLGLAVALLALFRAGEAPR